MTASRERDTPAETPELAGPSPCPAALLAAIQAGDANARLALWEAMRDWQRTRDAREAATDYYIAGFDDRCAAWHSQPDAPDYTAAVQDIRRTSAAFTARDGWLLAVLCEWERCSGLPFPGVTDPESSQGAYLTLERDWERELRVVRRVPAWPLTKSTEGVRA